MGRFVCGIVYRYDIQYAPYSYVKDMKDFIGKVSRLNKTNTIVCDINS